MVPRQTGQSREGGELRCGCVPGVVLHLLPGMARVKGLASRELMYMPCSPRVVRIDFAYVYYKSNNDIRVSVIPNGGCARAEEGVCGLLWGIYRDTWHPLMQTVAAPLTLRSSWTARVASPRRIFS